MYLPEEASVLKMAYFTDVNAMQTSLSMLFRINLSKTILVSSLLKC